MNRKPSFTAFVVIRALVAVSRGKHHVLVPPDAAALYAEFSRDMQRRDLFLRLLGGLPDCLISFLLDRLLANGALVHFAMRKNTIEQYVRNLIAQGVTQIINLGAGYDVLLLRLARENPALRCIEVDHPLTQASKTALLERCAAPLPANLHFTACDMAVESLRHVLNQGGVFDAQGPALFILEGITMYLNEAQNANLLHEMGLASESTRIIFTAAAPAEGEGFLKMLRNRILKHTKEDFAWLATPESVRSLLRKAGYTLDRQWEFCEMQAGVRTAQKLETMRRQVSKQSRENIYAAKAEN